MSLYQFLYDFYNEDSEWTPLAYVYSINDDCVLFQQPLCFLREREDILCLKFDSFEFDLDKSMLRFNVEIQTLRLT